MATNAVATRILSVCSAQATDALTAAYCAEVEYRYDEQMPTMISTNLMPSEIRSKYGDRIADRLNEMAIVIVFKNASYRK